MVTITINLKGALRAIFGLLSLGLAFLAGGVSVMPEDYITKGRWSTVLICCLWAIGFLGIALYT